MKGRAVAISGAGGFVGSLLARRFEADGWTVLRLSHSAGVDAHTVPFQLGEPVDPAVFERSAIQALVHCAYDFGPRKREDVRRVNVEGSRLLLAAATAGGVQRVAVMSTISAFDGCRSEYGRAKLEIESAALEAGALVIRSGLVYGDGEPDAGGMFGSLARSAQRSLVPLVDGGVHPQYLIHEEDLFQLVRGYCVGEMANPGRPLVAASPRAWSLRDLLAELARRQGRSPRFLAVPWQPVWAGLRLAEFAHLPVPFRSDSVISLVHQDRQPDFEPLAATGIEAREFSR
jgi:nucleoside-diphosphate-sugar epimerase